MIKNVNENTMELRIVIAAPEGADEQHQPSLIDVLDGEEMEIGIYAELVAAHLENLLNKTMLEDEILWLLSCIVDMGMSRPWEAVNLIKAVFLSANNTDGRRAINRVIDLCGEDENLYEFFIDELIDADFIYRHIEEIGANHNAFYEED